MYPNCKVDYPSFVGDDSYDSEYNIEDCKWDGGDCGDPPNDGQGFAWNI